MARIQIITLTTDFGTRDAYVGTIKGIILSMAPRVTLVDITHEIQAHDIMAASFVLAQSAPYFPKDTLHVAIVDPTVGTDRRILAARLGGQYFLLPDNGLITFVAKALPLEEIVTVRNTAYLPPPNISMTFHGRDIFAPLAGHLANGLDLRTLGPRPETFKLLGLPPVRQDGPTLIGEVVYVDTFGNLITNIPAQLVRDRWAMLDDVCVRCAGRDVGTLQGTYGFVDQDQPLALFNSSDLVEVAINRGRASDVLQAGVGAEIRLATRGG